MLKKRNKPEQNKRLACLVLQPVKQTENSLLSSDKEGQEYPNCGFVTSNERSLSRACTPPSFPQSLPLFCGLSLLICAGKQIFYGM